MRWRIQFSGSAISRSEIGCYSDIFFDRNRPLIISRFVISQLLSDLFLQVVKSFFFSFPFCFFFKLMPVHAWAALRVRHLSNMVKPFWVKFKQPLTIVPLQTVWRFKSFSSGHDMNDWNALFSQLALESVCNQSRANLKIRFRKKKKKRNAQIRGITWQASMFAIQLITFVLFAWKNIKQSQSRFSTL